MAAGGVRIAPAGGGAGSQRSAGGQGRGGAATGTGGRGFTGQLSGEALERMQALRAQVESGAISQDSMRAAMQALGGRVGGSGAADGGEDSTARETRPAAVFVVLPDGTIEPRLVQMGIGDWDNTEIVSGVEEGDVLVIVGPAQLQAQQEAFLEQMRGRMGGANPFGGTAVPGGGRGFPGGGGGRGN
jgi:HlyD family secretion protein